MSLTTPPRPRLSESSPSPALASATGATPTATGRRAWSLVLALLLAVSGAIGVLVGPSATTAEASARTPIMQPNRVSAEGIAAWYRTAAPSGYRATVPPATLARYFVEEGRAEGVAGDIAFAQAILETGWFRWPSHGQVHATYNNFGGIGACDGGTCTVARFRDARIGARAQMQHLRAYADPNVTVALLANPLESPRFHLVTPKGRTPNWEQMGGGNWATDPQYATKILSIYRNMLTHAERNGGLESSRPVVLAPAQRFADVWAGHSHRTAIEELAKRDVVRGCTTNRFCPEDTVNRAQAASLIAGALDLPSAPSPFSDVGPTHLAAVGALSAANVTSGCGGDRFCPGDGLTRGQMATMLQRAFDLPPATATFRDTRGHRHAAGIAAVAAAGITTGYDDGTFRPDERVTRAQAATFLLRALP